MARTNKKRYAVVCCEWTEYERGWGQRPDGASFHATLEDHKQYIKEYWDREKEINPSGAVPDEYSRESETVYVVDVPKETYDKVKASKNGIMLWQTEYSKLKYPEGWKQDAENRLNPRKVVSHNSDAAISVADAGKLLR